MAANKEPDGFKKRFGNAWAKGYKAFQATQGYKYIIKFNSSKSCVVSVIDKTIKGKKNWVIRFDRAHTKGATYNHININPKISGIKDPHIPLPPGGLTAAKGVTKVVQGFNKIALPLSIAFDSYQATKAMFKDHEKGTTRNTVETVANIGGGWFGGYGGAVGGAALGSAFFPGVGTIVGGIIGGITGGLGGAAVASDVTNKIGDKIGYNIEERRCERCHRSYEWRIYLDEEPECPHCEPVKFDRRYSDGVIFQVIDTGTQNLRRKSF